MGLVSELERDREICLVDELAELVLLEDGMNWPPFSSAELPPCCGVQLVDETSVTDVDGLVCCEAGCSLPPLLIKASVL